MKIPKKIALWPHQNEAVSTIAPFLSEEVGVSKADRSSALINIPTGGGKTAVIAALAHWHPKLKRALVLAPRQAIRKQLAAELSSSRGFLKRCGYSAATLPKQVLELETAAALPPNPEDNLILLSTIQLIDEMARQRDSSPEYDRLAKWCDAIFVDEGHYEPARRWNVTLRGLGRPIVLVTATPYRNDLKTFMIDRSATSICTYSQLTTRHYLRSVEVAPAPETAMSDPAKFVDSVLGTFTKYYGSAPSTSRKLIIRCPSRTAIQQICDAIRVHPDGHGGVLGLHEEFTSDPTRPWERRQPADPETKDAPAIWVHQHKLLEGVDGPSFRALALYGILGSARALVQQVGRVIRNPDLDTSEKSLVVDHFAGLVEDRWNRFLEFDSHLDSGTLFAGIDQFSRDFDAALPPIVYVDQQFRRRFSFGVPSDKIRASLRLPLRCHLYQGDKANLSRLLGAMKDRLLDAEYPFEVLRADEDEILILFEKLQSSPLLDEHYFMERELHCFIAQRKGKLVAILDTSRQGLDKQCALEVGGRLQVRWHNDCSPIAPTPG